MLKEIFSAVALVTTIVGLVPQIYKTYRTKSASDLSMLMLANYVVGSSAWIGYGCLGEDNTVIIANVFCASTALVSIGQKIYYDRFYRHEVVVAGDDSLV